MQAPRARYTDIEHEYVSLEEILQLIAVPHDEGDLALLRDKAAAALLFLSGARASAFTTFPISALDLSARTLRQWPELGVATKNGKHATTFLLPIPELLSVAQAWDDLVHSKLQPSAPWYAPISAQWGCQSLEEVTPGKNRHQSLDKRLRRLFSLAGLPYKSAHKFRHGHAVYGLQHAQTMADYKAVSMNLMHEDIKITDEIYAPIMSNEVRYALAGCQTRSRARWKIVSRPWFVAYQTMISPLSCGLSQTGWSYDAYALAQSFQTVYNAKQISDNA